MVTEKHVIIGGGLAGLYLAQRLAMRDETREIHVYERNARFGGRVLTVDDAKECAAFRVHKSHAQVRKLCKELGVKLKPWNYKTTIEGESKDSTKEYSNLPIKGNGFTMFDQAIMRGTGTTEEVLLALREERQTGYMDSFKGEAAAHNPSFYVDESNNAFYYAPGGLSSIIHALVSSVKDLGVQLHVSTRVDDVDIDEDKQYQVTLQTRQGKEVTTATHIWLAAPPAACESFSCFRRVVGGLLHAAAVEKSPLHRLYARVKLTKGKKVEGQWRWILPDSPLGQIWTVPPMEKTPSDLLQVSYTEGRLAEFWHHLYRKSPEACRQYLLLALQQAWPDVINITDLESHYWDTAVHHWQPSPIFSTPSPHSYVVHAKHLPNMFICGEAVSQQQTWMEGALTSVQDALQAADTKAYWKKHGFLAGAAKKNDEVMVINDRVVRVAEWKSMHPGSQPAVQRHIHDKDAGNVWSTIHSQSPYARSMLYHLTIGYVL